MPNLTPISQVLTGSIPYSGCNDAVAMSKIRAGKKPKRPSEGIYDPVWQFLKECWSIDGRKRPSAAKVYSSFLKFRAIEELPKKLKLEVQSIDVPFIVPVDPTFELLVVYGNWEHRIEVTYQFKRTVGRAPCEYIWFVFRPTQPPLLH